MATATIRRLEGSFPFAPGGPAFTDNTPYNGGWLRIIPAKAATANLGITHALRATPKFCWVLDISTNSPFATPLQRGSSAWTAASIFVNWPLTSASVTLWLAG